MSERLVATGERLAPGDGARCRRSAGLLRSGPQGPQRTDLNGRRATGAALFNGMLAGAVGLG